MASENKTRQEMIEMMYLVLTALLALNVSKEVVAAFITMNNKLNQSSQVIKKGSETMYHTFDGKRAAINAQHGNLAEIDLWQGKATAVSKRTDNLVQFLLSESNYLIKKTEGTDWAERDKNGKIIKLKSLMDIKAKTNFDIPTNVFVGSEPRKPNARGMALRDSVLSYRDFVTKTMGTYSRGDKHYSFTPPKDPSKLREALMTANPKDTAKIAQIYNGLTIPEKIEVSDAGETITLPWSSGMFEHTPVVAAAALISTMKLNVLNNESRAAEFFLAKVDAPTFHFNKIEPLAFAQTGYINAGDSLNLRVMIAAYDSTDAALIRYGINDSTPEDWTQIKQDLSKGIALSGKTPGEYSVKGVIGVKVKGQRQWKPWEFNYTVGKPSGTVSLPEMNVLYRGYDNIVTGAASGYPNYSLSGAGNVSLRKSGDHYIASPGRGRFASISIAGVAKDGSRASLGTFKFRVQNMPKPEIRLGRIQPGESATSAQFRAARRLFAGYPPSIPLKATFSVTKWEMTVSGAPRPISGSGSTISSGARRMIANAPSGSIVTVVATVRSKGGSMRQIGAYTIK